jgi:hypothetical protein
MRISAQESGAGCFHQRQPRSARDEVSALTGAPLWKSRDGGLVDAAR